MLQSRTGPKWPCAHKHKTFFFFACGSSAPVRVEHAGGAAVWLAGTPVAPSVQGHKLPPWQELQPYQSLFFWASCSWQSEGLFGQSFSTALPVQALRGLPCLGSFSVVQHVRHIEGTPWMGSYSVDWHIRNLKEHPGWSPTLKFSAWGVWWARLYFSAANAGVWGERGYGGGSTPYAWLSSIPLFHGCLVFLHRHFPSRSPPSDPLNPSRLSQQQPSHWDCSTVPKLQLPATAPSRRPTFLPSICMAVARTVWFSFHLGCHRSAVSPSALNVSPLTQTIAPLWGSDPCFSSPPGQG